MRSIVNSLDIVCRQCYHLAFSPKQIEDFIKLVGSYGYSTLHKEFPKEFFTLIDYIYIETQKIKAFIFSAKCGDLFNQSGRELFDKEFLMKFPQNDDAVYPRYILEKMFILNDISREQFERMVIKRHIYPRKISFR